MILHMPPLVGFPIAALRHPVLPHLGAWPWWIAGLH